MVGSDGTVVMTGKSIGFIASLETLIRRPLQKVICLLHINELPLRHVFQNLDVVTSGPDSFSGPIGRQLNGAVYEWKVVKFKSIPNPKFPVIPNSLMDNKAVINIMLTKFALPACWDKLMLILSFSK